MPRYLLDTNIASYYVKNLYPALRYRMRSMPWDDLAISAITEAEMRAGLAKLLLEATLCKIVPAFLSEISILPWDTACAKEYGQIVRRQREIGRPLTLLDGMIAAHALVLDLTLISADDVFSHVIGLNLQNWARGPHLA